MSTCVRPLIASIAVVVVGCGSNSSEAHQDTSAAASRVEKCSERIVERLASEDSAKTTKEELRRYVETTYCAPFEHRGRIYDDGTLSIAAYLDLVESGSCALAEAGQETRTVPCEELDRSGPQTLDCAMLHYVRNSEVRKYIEKLQRSREVRCDDGTPLQKLGA